MKLSQQAIASLPEGYTSDGNNLYIRVRKGVGSFVFRYKRPIGTIDAGKPVEMGLGKVSEVKLSEARQVAQRMREYIASKRDPSLVINAIRAEGRIEANLTLDDRIAKLEARVTELTNLITSLASA